MTDPVYIGLAVTSHVDAATLRTFTFDSVSTTATSHRTVLLRLG
jgi:hypothetical protein